MSRTLFSIVVFAGAITVGWFYVQSQPTWLARPQASTFASPYNTSQPLEGYLVFSAPPRANVPDGQIHWTEGEVPGIDILGPDGAIHNMCPDGGQAWTQQGGDPFGGGTFVAVECQGGAEGWQMLAFHLCEVGIQYSISAANRVYTRVPSGALVGRECAGGHTHLSLGYWAQESARLPLPCPQWYVQGRYWVNPACLLQAGDLAQTLPRQLARSGDWELRYLTPRVLNPLKRFAVLAVSVTLSVYLLFAVLRDAPERRKRLDVEALFKTGIWISFIILLIVLSAGPVWPIQGSRSQLYTSDPSRYRAMAEEVGYGDWELLRAFYQAAVPRDAAGQPVAGGEPGKVFPPEAAAAIPFGETNAEPWSLVDPTEPGPYGRHRAWEAVAERWPPSLYERLVLGLTVSRAAQRQREGLETVAASPDIQQLARELGKPIRAQDLYGSSAGALGRTQILPGHFARGGVCGDLATMDVWNDPDAVAECTTRYLTVNGCWGSWWVNGDVWSALCGYNPGAWDTEPDQWYWAVLQDRMTRLAAAQVGVSAVPEFLEALAPPSRRGQINVSTPVLGLLITEALLQNGQSGYRLPGPLNSWLSEIGPALRGQHETVRIAYRVFRAWTLIYYSPEELLALGIQV